MIVRTNMGLSFEYTCPKRWDASCWTGVCLALAWLSHPQLEMSDSVELDVFWERVHGDMILFSCHVPYVTHGIVI